MAEEKEKKKTKRPSALKREIQGEKRRLINKSFKSKVRTAERSFEEALTTRNKDSIQTALNTFYSLMDKGVKQGIYKANKANRAKSRFVAKVAKTA